MQPRRFDRWLRYLTAPEDGASLAVFRVLFGSIMIWEVVRYFSGGRIERYYIEPRFFFSFLPFVKPWVGAGMYAHFILTGALAAMVALGLFYRIAAPLFCVGITYIFLLDKTNYLNHVYLVCLISFLMTLLPANRAFSLDRRFFFPSAPEVVPRYSLLILRAQIALVYFYGGIAKLNKDWLRGEPIGTWLYDRSGDTPVIGPLMALPFAGLVFAYSGLLIDLSVGFLLFFRRTFLLGVGIVVLFNGLNSLIFNIGIFPHFMLASLSLFADPSWPRRVLERLSPGAGPPPAADEPAIERPRMRPREAALIAFLHVYMLAQLTVPLRHWFYPGDVNWNEEGHRFSWRMKLRDKDVRSFAMYVVNPKTGARETIDPLDWLSQRQYDKMITRPDMIEQFAKYVASKREAQLGVRPIVNAEVEASLNSGPNRALINPKVDLAAPDPGPLTPLD